LKPAKETVKKLPKQTVEKPTKLVKPAKVKEVKEVKVKEIKTEEVKQTVQEVQKQEQVMNVPEQTIKAAPGERKVIRQLSDEEMKHLEYTTRTKMRGLINKF
jgi:hypothetical protein